MNTAALWKELLETLQSRLLLLPDKPEENADNTLRALWLTASGSPQSAVQAAQTEIPPLDSDQIATLRDLVSCRLDGQPLAHLTGRQHFMGLEMLAGPEALVPRQETELLARAAIDKAIALSVHGSPLLVLDVCTGSGNVALAVTAELKHRKIPARTLGADISEEAIALAASNANWLELSDITEFRAGDLLAPFDSSAFLGTIDLLTCNPPYINQAKVEHMAAEISEHEPRLAFDGGPFGVSILMRLLEDAPRFIKPGGWLVFEVGLGQGPALIKRMERNPLFQELSPVCDNEGAIRAICARRS